MDEGSLSPESAFEDAVAPASPADRPTPIWGRPRALAWAVLVIPLGLLLWGAATLERLGWSDLAAGEPTVLMAAESVAHDRDLAYSRLDYDRHLLTHYGPPRDLALASGSKGRRITYDLPFPIALWLAPFVAWQPTTGFALGQALLLILGAVFSAWRLEHRMGFLAPLFVAVAVFASITFAHAFLATVDLALFVAVLAAASLWSTPSRYRPGGGPGQTGGASGGASGGTWDDGLAGFLLSVPLMSQPLNLWLLPLFVGVALLDSRPIPDQVPRPYGPRLATWGLGLSLGVVLLAVGQWWNGGGLRLYGTSAFRFSPASGYPLVDFPAEEWGRQVESLSALFFDGAPRLAWGFDAALWAWNVLFLMLGESQGILLYFLPILFLATAAPRKLGLWLAIAVGWTLTLLIMHPFTLSGGETLGNRLFLPIFAASALIWRGGLVWAKRSGPLGEKSGSEATAHGDALAPNEPRSETDSPEPAARRGAPFGRRAAGAAGALLVPLAAFSSFFLDGVWTGIGQPIASVPDGYTYPSRLARSFFPLETSQQPLPLGPFLDHRGLRVRLTSGVEEARLDLFTLHPPHRASLWVASTEPLDRLHLEFGADAPAKLQPRAGIDDVEILLRADGGVSFAVEVAGRNHAMWWSPHRQWIYRLAFGLEGAPEHPLYFRLAGQEPIPEDTAPEDTVPEDAAPEDAASGDTAPEVAADGSEASEGATPAPSESRSSPVVSPEILGDSP